MSTVFLDTSYLIALLHRRDSMHDLAVAAARLVPGPFVTTDYVLLEFLDSLAGLDIRAAALAAERALRADARTRIISAADDLQQAGTALYASRPDKEWGLTNCISFEAMRRLGISDALTSDAHFEQAGFRALLRG